MNSRTHSVKEYGQKIVLIAIGISLLILPFYLGWKYIIGFFAGVYIAGRFLLFPNVIAQFILPIIFKDAYSNLQGVILYDKEKTTEFNKYKIRK